MSKTIILHNFKKTYNPKLKKMAKSFFLCFLLANAFLGLAMVAEEPAASPFSSPSHFRAEAPVTRKLGKHHQHSLSPAEAPQSEEKLHSSKEEGIPGHERTSMEPESEEVAGPHGEKGLSKQHHHSFDKSIAGGGVILGGLATTFLVSVFCYIRATARNKPEATTAASSL